MRQIPKWVKSKFKRLRPPRKLVTVFLTLGLLTGSTVALSAAPALAVGSYNNATIATDGLADVGTYGGQCKAFANAMVNQASGGTQSPTGYQSGWAALGVQVASANAVEGDIIQITPANSTDQTAESLYQPGVASAELHTAIVVSNNGGGSFTVVDSNWGHQGPSGWVLDGMVQEHTFNPYTWAQGSIIDIWQLGTVSGSGPSNTVAVIGDDYSIWAQSGLVTGGSWKPETGANSAKTISSGDGTQVWLDDCNAIWAQTSIGSGVAVQESDCNTSQKVIVSSTGIQMELDGCGALWAKDSVGYGGWNRETDCNAATQIAIGGNTQAWIDYCGAIWAQTSIGSGVAVQEAGCNSAKSLSVGSSGTQVWLDDCNAIWAQTSIGSGVAVQEAGCNAGNSITIGNNDQVILNQCGALWAKDSVGYGGWSQETGCNAATVVSIGAEDNQFVIGLDGSVWARTGIGNSWTQQAGASSAVAISAG